jgi:glycosyltransferase involved in cell wall biosynthesis
MDYPVRRNWYSDYLYNRRVDGIIAISHKIAAVLVEGGVRKQKIRVIYTGVEPERFQIAGPIRLDSAEVLIATVAVLGERKGHQYLLEAAAFLKEAGYSLKYRFAGEGSQKEHLQKMAIELRLKEEVVFDGFVRDIPKFLSEIDIFVLPSLYEGMGVAVLEAMAAGKPVVASNVGGIPELIEDGVTGLLVPPGDPNTLAMSISRLVSQRSLMNEMGTNGCERVRRHFTMTQTAKKIEDYYYQLRAVPQNY